MDVHVPKAITDGLRRRGVDVLTSQDDGTSRYSDDEILDRTTVLDRLLFTQDADFLAIANQRSRDGIPFSGILYGHQLGAGIGQFIDDITLICQGRIL